MDLIPLPPNCEIAVTAKAPSAKPKVAIITPADASSLLYSIAIPDSARITSSTPLTETPQHHVVG